MTMKYQQFLVKLAVAMTIVSMAMVVNAREFEHDDEEILDSLVKRAPKFRFGKRSNSDSVEEDTPSFEAFLDKVMEESKHEDGDDEKSSALEKRAPKFRFGKRAPKFLFGKRSSLKTLEGAELQDFLEKLIDHEETLDSEEEMEDSTPEKRAVKFRFGKRAPRFQFGKRAVNFRFGK